MTSPSLGAQYANQAAEVAAKLKPGPYDAVQALAFVSSAQSLAQIAAAMEQKQQE